MEIHPTGTRPAPEDREPSADPIVTEVEGLLAEERYEEALDRAEAALARGEGNALDLCFLAGDALLWLGEPEQAEERFREVLARDPDCPSSRCWLAMALYRQLRFDEAAAELALAMASPEALPDCHVVQGLLLERRGDHAGADAAFRRAAAADPDRYFEPMRLSREDFDALVVEASDRLPPQFRRHLQDLPVIVQDLPAVEILRSDDGPLDPDLLGLFVGPALGDASHDPGGSHPDASYIYLFQRNLERFARDLDELRRQIAITIYHELGHYLGLEEEELDEIGLG